MSIVNTTGTASTFNVWVLPSLVSTTDSGACSVYPDIVVHHRSTKENLLIVEAKKGVGNPSFSRDEEKLRAFTRSVDTHGLVLMTCGPKPTCQIRQWIELPAV